MAAYSWDQIEWDRLNEDAQLSSYVSSRVEQAALLHGCQLRGAWELVNPPFEHGPICRYEAGFELERVNRLGAIAAWQGAP